MVIVMILAAVVAVAIGILVLPGLGILGLVIGVVLVAAVAAWALRLARRPDAVARDARERTEPLPVGPRLPSDEAEHRDPDAPVRERAHEIQG
jgi:hypothetical protein